VLAALVLPVTLPALALDEQVMTGQRIYQNGVTREGLPVRATGAGGSSLGEARAACVVCHRRSGMGSREGSVAVPAVAGPVLYAKVVPNWPVRPGRKAPNIKPLRQDSRDAYDDAGLARAIRDGIDPNGRTLDPLMPRYELGEADLIALTAYLRKLSAAQIPGLNGGRLQLATIVTPDADPARARIVSEALTAWSRSGALGGMPMELHVWAIEGPASGWGEQLRAYNQTRPVYAVISGAGRAEWAPVRDFCEQASVPCLFPIVDFAPEDAPDYYSMYLSRGVPLEARILARHLKEMTPPPARVVQLVAGEAGARAAEMLAGEMGDVVQETRSWRSAPPVSMIEGLNPTDVVIGWLNPAQLNDLAKSRPQGLDTRMAVFSGQLAPPEKTDLPSAWRTQARWISLHSDPRRLQGKGVLGLSPWLTHLKLAAADEALLSQVYAATYYFGDALARMRGHWSREYLLETLETANYARPAGAAFFSLSLGPGQREAAKAGHFLGFAGPALDQVVTFGPRLAP
jgi:hypothetical protein